MGCRGIEMAPIFGLFCFRHVRQGSASSTPLRCCLWLFLLGAADRAFGRSACRCAPSRTTRCAAAAVGVPVNARLIAVYTLAAFYAGDRRARCSPQTTALASLDVFAFERSADLMLVLVIGGSGYLYGRTDRRRGIQDAAGSSFPISRRNTGNSGSGLVLVVIVLVGRAPHAPLGAVLCRT